MIQHTELRGSRSGTDATDRGSTAELVWSVWGSNDLDACRDYLSENDVVPSLYDGLVYKSLSWEHLGNGIWEFRASYVHPDKSDQDETLDVGEYTFNFDTSGGTVKRTVSLSTTSYPKSGETPPDFKSAIGVNDDPDKEVEGVEIGIPALKFSIRKRVPRATLNLAFVKRLAGMTFTYNNESFLGFESGELLFVGASGSQATNSDPEILYNFIASPNVTDLSVGEIQGVTKLGHEYLWVYFEKIADGSANATVKQPKAAYVEEVYESSDFGNLGIV